jgi:hypothetical protein
MERAYQRPSGVGANRAVAFETRPQTSSRSSSWPSPNTPEGARRHEVRHEARVVAHPLLLRQVHAGGVAQHVPGRQVAAGVPEELRGAVGEAAILPTPGTRPYHRERQRLLQPLVGLGDVTRRQRADRRDHGEGEVRVRVIGIAGEALHHVVEHRLGARLDRGEDDWASSGLR